MGDAGGEEGQVEKRGAGGQEGLLWSLPRNWLCHPVGWGGAHCMGTPRKSQLSRQAGRINGRVHCSPWCL